MDQVVILFMITCMYKSASSAAPAELREAVRQARHNALPVAKTDVVAM